MYRELVDKVNQFRATPQDSIQWNPDISWRIRQNMLKEANESFSHLIFILTNNNTSSDKKQKELRTFLAERAQIIFTDANYFSFFSFPINQACVAIAEAIALNNEPLLNILISKKLHLPPQQALQVENKKDGKRKLINLNTIEFIHMEEPSFVHALEKLITALRKSTCTNFDAAYLGIQLFYDFWIKLRPEKQQHIALITHEQESLASYLLRLFAAVPGCYITEKQFKGIPSRIIKMLTHDIARQLESFLHNRAFCLDTTSPKKLESPSAQKHQFDNGFFLYERSIYYPYYSLMQLFAPYPQILHQTHDSITEGNNYYTQLKLLLPLLSPKKYPILCDVVGTNLFIVETIQENIFDFICCVNAENEFALFSALRNSFILSDKSLIKSIKDEKADQHAINFYLNFLGEQWIRKYILYADCIKEKKPHKKILFITKNFLFLLSRVPIENHMDYFKQFGLEIIEGLLPYILINDKHNGLFTKILVSIPLAFWQQILSKKLLEANNGALFRYICQSHFLREYFKHPADHKNFLNKFAKLVIRDITDFERVNEKYRCEFLRYVRHDFKELISSAQDISKGIFFKNNLIEKKFNRLLNYYHADHKKSFDVLCSKAKNMEEKVALLFKDNKKNQQSYRWFSAPTLGEEIIQMLIATSLNKVEKICFLERKIWEVENTANESLIPQLMYCIELMSTQSIQPAFLGALVLT